jgi:putative salt-induced outer membrane protein YdiY
MQRTLFVAVLATLTTGALAQDKITLANGDVITGTIKTMADGKVTITSPLLGDVVVPMANVGDMVTQAQVELQKRDGETWKRRILGIESGSLRIEGEPASLALGNLAVINPPPEVEPTWDGSLKLNALWTDGNTDERAVGAAFDASIRRKVDRITVDAAWDYGETKDNSQDPATRATTKLTQRRAGAGLKYDYFFVPDNDRLYALVTARVLGDTLADLDLRFSGGAGIGYLWITDETTTFQTEVGISYVSETYRSGVPSEEYTAARCAYKLKQQLSAATKLEHGVEAFPSTEGTDDFYMQAKTEIITSLTESMLASLAHVLDYDNTPSSAALERVDNRVVLSIGWSF